MRIEDEDGQYRFTGAQGLVEGCIVVQAKVAAEPEDVDSGHERRVSNDAKQDQGKIVDSASA